MAIVVVPFAIVGWQGLWDSFEAQAERSLQVESLGGALLLAADRLGLYEARVVSGSTAAVSRDLAGTLPDALASVSSLLQLAAVGVVVWLFVRVRADGERLVAGAAATLAGVLAFSKFISPQYLVWLLPLVPLVVPPIGFAAAALLALAMVLGQLWFFHYRELFADGGVVWLVGLRDALLVVLFAVLAAALLLRTKMPSSSRTVDQAPLASRRARNRRRRGRGATVEVGRASQVDRDPVGLTNDREAEDSPPSREVGAETVRAADRRVARNEVDGSAAMRSCADLRSGTSSPAQSGPSATAPTSAATGTRSASRGSRAAPNTAPATRNGVIGAV